MHSLIVHIFYKEYTFFCKNVCFLLNVDVRIFPKNIRILEIYVFYFIFDAYYFACAYYYYYFNFPPCASLFFVFLCVTVF